VVIKKMLAHLKEKAALEPCQPLGRPIRGGCGLVSIVASEKEFLRVVG